MTLPTTGRHALPLLSAGQAQKEIAHNEALLIADFAMNAVVEAMGLDSPPASPVAGEAWIVGEEPAGAWAGHAGEIACWTAGGWRFLMPFKGLHVWIASVSLWARRTAEGWTTGIVEAGEVRIGGQKIIGERGGAIVNPSGGVTIDAEARAAIASVLSELRAHGLISP